MVEIPVRVQIICDGKITSDETAPERSIWRAIVDLLDFGDYRYKLREFVTVDGWLQFTCDDGTIVRAVVIH